MIIDANLTFSENQAITATAISTNVVEFPDNDIVPYEAAAMSRNLGAGNEIPLMIQVTEAFNNLTSLTITLESSAAAGLTSSTVHWTSGAIPLASLVAGYKPPNRVLPDGVMLKYLGLRYTVTGTAPSTGKVSAALATEVSS